MDILDRQFLAATAERAVKTFAQALLAAFGAGQAGILDVDWSSALSVAALAAVASILTSVVSTVPAVPPVVSVAKPGPGVDVPVSAPEPPPVEP